MPDHADDMPLDAPAQAFYALSPDKVIDAVESLGYWSDGRILSLNSFENRVYQVGIEDGDPVIAKFYRPARWSDAAIREEHAFTLELADAELPVVAPLLRDGESLFESHGYRVALFPRRGGYAPEAGDENKLGALGQLMGRLHAVSAEHRFQHRPVLDAEETVHTAMQHVGPFLPGTLHAAYRDAADAIRVIAVAALEECGSAHFIRCHGDCHMGNILYRDSELGGTANILDFDDCMMAPAVQDIWMFLAGNILQERNALLYQLDLFLEGYERFASFDTRQLRLIEALRALRMVRHAGWVAHRWADPFFRKHFSWFAEPSFWQRHVNDLQDQLHAMRAPPLSLYG